TTREDLRSLARGSNGDRVAAVSRLLADGRVVRDPPGRGAGRYIPVDRSGRSGIGPESVRGPTGIDRSVGPAVFIDGPSDPDRAAPRLAHDLFDRSGAGEKSGRAPDGATPDAASDDGAVSAVSPGHARSLARRAAAAIPAGFTPEPTEDEV